MMMYRNGLTVALLLSVFVYETQCQGLINSFLDFAMVNMPEDIPGTDMFPGDSMFPPDMFPEDPAPGDAGNTGPGDPATPADPAGPMDPAFPAGPLPAEPGKPAEEAPPMDPDVKPVDTLTEAIVPADPSPSTGLGQPAVLTPMETPVNQPQSNTATNNNNNIPAVTNRPPISGGMFLSNLVPFNLRNINAANPPIDTIDPGSPATSAPTDPLGLDFHFLPQIPVGNPFVNLVTGNTNNFDEKGSGLGTAGSPLDVDILTMRDPLDFNRPAILDIGATQRPVNPMVPIVNGANPVVKVTTKAPAVTTQRPTTTTTMQTTTTTKKPTTTTTQATTTTKEEAKVPNGWMALFPGGQPIQPEINNNSPIIPMTPTERILSEASLNNFNKDRNMAVRLRQHLIKNRKQMRGRMLGRENAPGQIKKQEAQQHQQQQLQQQQRQQQQPIGLPASLTPVQIPTIARMVLPDRNMPSFVNTGPGHGRGRGRGRGRRRRRAQKCPPGLAKKGLCDPGFDMGQGSPGRGGRGGGKGGKGRGRNGKGKKGGKWQGGVGDGMDAGSIGQEIQAFEQITAQGGGGGVGRGGLDGSRGGMGGRGHGGAIVGPAKPVTSLQPVAIRQIPPLSHESAASHVNIPQVVHTQTGADIPPDVIDHSDPNHTHPVVGNIENIAGFGMIDWSQPQGV